MLTDELRLIQLLSRNFDSSMTINQISKAIGKSYGYTNKFVRDLISQEIISRKIVGSAILCSLNYSNETVIGLLVLASIQNRKKVSSKTMTLIAEQEDHILTAYEYDGELYIVSNADIFSKQFKTISKTEFALGLHSLDFSKLVILYNHELFWRQVGRMR